MERAYTKPSDWGDAAVCFDPSFRSKGTCEADIDGNGVKRCRWLPWRRVCLPATAARGAGYLWDSPETVAACKIAGCGRGAWNGVINLIKDSGDMLIGALLGFLYDSAVGTMGVMHRSAALQLDWMRTLMYSLLVALLGPASFSNGRGALATGSVLTNFVVAIHVNIAVSPSAHAAILGVRRVVDTFLASFALTEEKKAIVSHCLFIVGSAVGLLLVAMSGVSPRQLGTVWGGYLAQNSIRKAMASSRQESVLEGLKQGFLGRNVVVDAFAADHDGELGDALFQKLQEQYDNLSKVRSGIVLNQQAINHAIRYAHYGVHQLLEVTSFGTAIDAITKIFETVTGLMDASQLQIGSGDEGSIRGNVSAAYVTVFRSGFRVVAQILGNAFWIADKVYGTIQYIYKKINGGPPVKEDAKQPKSWQPFHDFGLTLPETSKVGWMPFGGSGDSKDSEVSEGWKPFTLDSVFGSLS